MCKKAKEDVTVMLCGEGADEQFGGYLKYVFEELSRAIDWMPASVRKAALRSLASAIPFGARRIRAILENLSVASRPARLAAWYGALDATTRRSLLSDNFWETVQDHDIASTFSQLLSDCDSEDRVEQFLYCDIHSRLVDHLLIKGDRMSMAASVEARVPFLDPRVVEFAAALPRTFKVNGTHTKIVLKKLAERYAPKELIYRRKVGFNLPLSQWFVGPLRRLVEGILLSEQFMERGYWNPDAVRELVSGHLEGRIDREQGIWVLLVLELWHRLFVDADGGERAVESLSEQFRTLLPRTAG
jgi:asparagine synthase (glutamine-hydrolysing)